MAGHVPLACGWSRVQGARLRWDAGGEHSSTHLCSQSPVLLGDTWVYVGDMWPGYQWAFGGYWKTVQG